MRVIRELDDGNGVEIGKIVDVMKLPIGLIDQLITELLDEEKIVEVLPSVFKINE